MSGGDNESNDADDYHRPAPATNGKRERHSDVSASPEPYSKHVKRASSSEDADARLAAQLQAQENSLARARTRGGDRPKVTKRKAPKKKSAKRVREDDDSDGDGSESGVKKRKAGGGFQKPFNLSNPLSELVGETQVSKRTAHRSAAYL